MAKLPSRPNDPQPTRNASVPAPPLKPVVSTEAIPEHVIYLPSNAAARQPLQVLVALHGMGNDGAGEAAPLLAQAEVQFGAARTGVAVASVNLPHQGSSVRHVHRGGGADGGPRPAGERRAARQDDGARAFARSQGQQQPQADERREQR